MAKVSFRRGPGVKHPFSDWNALRPELSAITESLGRFPSDSDLQAMKRNDIRHAIADYHGGFVNAQKKMGFQPKRKVGEMSLSKWENFEREVRKLAEKIGHFPSKKDFLDNKKAGLHAFIARHGGIDSVRTKMGFSLGHRTKERSLRNWKNFEPEFRKTWQELGHFPTWSELEALKRQDLLNGLGYHGGMIGVREKFRQRQLARVGKDSLSIWKNLRLEFDKVFNELDYFPNEKELARMGKFDLIKASNHFGGVEEVRKKMKVPERPKPRTVFNSWEIFEREMASVQEKLHHFPTIPELTALNRGDLRHAIDNHGGIDEVRKRMNAQPLIMRGENSLREWRNFRAELIKAKKQLGHFPSLTELTTIGRGDLRNAARFHGGYNKVRQKFKVPLAARFGETSLRKFENIEAEIRKAIKANNGVFPTVKRLQELERYDILHALRFHGGLEKVQRRMGFKPKRAVGEDSFMHWPNVRKKLEQVTARLGHFPRPVELSRLGLNSFEASVSKYHGGLVKARARVGVEKAMERKKKEANELSTQRVLMNPKNSPASVKPIAEEILRLKEKMQSQPPSERQRISGIISSLEERLSEELKLLRKRAAN